MDPSQTRAIAAALVYARERYMGDDRTLREVLDAVMADITRQGLDVLSRYPAGDHAAFRRHEFAAALNRLRPLRVRRSSCALGRARSAPDFFDFTSLNFQV